MVVPSFVRVKPIKQKIKENKDKNSEKNQENLSLISSIMLRKLSLKQKKCFFL